MIQRYCATVLFAALLLFHRTATGFLSLAAGPAHWRFGLEATTFEDAEEDQGTIISLQESYARARDIRTNLGHEAACPHYQHILKRNPEDRTAGTRLAASPRTNLRHEQACGGETPSAKRGRIQELQAILMAHNYTHDQVARFFGVPRQTSLSCEGPLFVSPVAPGSVTTSNWPLSENPSGLTILISLFLLSLAVPQRWIEAAFGGEPFIRLLQDLGLAFPCETDPSLLVPYVHIFPLDFAAAAGPTLYLVTDLHPRVTSTISLGDGTGNAVMYIGPDSLALAQHFHEPSSHTAEPGRLLDLGTGSGVQALSALRHCQSTSLEAVAVDVNPRALRFTRFNSILNGLEDQVSLIDANLLLEESSLQLSNKFRFILANPPFLPVPNRENSPGSSIDRRYGLFSSGGPSGEDLLERIVQLASSHLSEGGTLAVVSEFFVQSHDPTFERFQSWWNTGASHQSNIYTAKGVLFLNEYPIDAPTYASRRADNSQEQTIWNEHLQSLNITACSPGLLYIQKEESCGQLDLVISRVPKTKMGSVWTPSNLDAIHFTQKASKEILGWRS